jgi:hypothetical protein
MKCLAEAFHHTGIIAEIAKGQHARMCQPFRHVCPSPALAYLCALDRFCPRGKVGDRSFVSLNEPMGERWPCFAQLVEKCDERFGLEVPSTSCVSGSDQPR